MKTRPRVLIGVIGGAEVDDTVRAQARDVGYEIGRRGFSLVCGGRLGVMEAVCEGLAEARKAHATDSVAIGVLPGVDSNDANRWVDIAIPTGIGIARNLVLVHSAAAIIAIDGSSGTLSELAFAWQIGKPIVALAGSGGVATAFAGRAVDDRRADVVISAQTPAQAVEMAVAAIEGRARFG